MTDLDCESLKRIQRAQLEMCKLCPDDEITIKVYKLEGEVLQVIHQSVMRLTNG